LLAFELTPGATGHAHSYLHIDAIILA
jgi:hypothetical protein